MKPHPTENAPRTTVTKQNAESPSDAAERLQRAKTEGLNNADLARALEKSASDISRYKTYIKSLIENPKEKPKKGRKPPDDFSYELRGDRWFLKD